MLSLPVSVPGIVDDRRRLYASPVKRLSLPHASAFDTDGPETLGEELNLILCTCLIEFLITYISSSVQGKTYDVRIDRMIDRILSYRRETALLGALVLAKMEDLNREAIFCGHNRSIFRCSRCYG